MTHLHGALPLFAVCDCGTLFLDHNHLPLSYLLSDGITGLNKNGKWSFACVVPISNNEASAVDEFEPLVGSPNEQMETLDNTDVKFDNSNKIIDS